MSNAIILHGTSDTEEYYSDKYPSLSNSHWLPWLQKQLLIKDIPAATPEIAHAYKPDYEVWKKEAERYEINEDTILVGHSTGGGFWLRYLSEHPELRVGKVVLVAPWLDPNNTKKTTFFTFPIDPEVVARTKGMTIMYSIDDFQGILWSVEIIRQTVPGIEFIEFDDKGHFCYEDMHTEKFPELLSEIVDKS